MQCGCPCCGTLMAHAVRGVQSRCVCAACSYECNDCMGTRFEVTIKKGEKLPESIEKRLRELENEIGC